MELENTDQEFAEALKEDAIPDRSAVTKNKEV